MRRGICVNTPQVAKDQTASVMSNSSLNRFLTAEYIIKYQNIDGERAARKGAKKLERFSVVSNGKISNEQICHLAAYFCHVKLMTSSQSCCIH